MFKLFCQTGKITLASILLVVPLAAQAAVDMNITSFTDNPDPAVAGGVFHYLLTIENSGDQNAPNAGLTVSIPSQVTVTNVTPSGTCSGTGPVVCNFGSLAGTLNGGSPINIDITMTATDAGPLSISSNASVSTTATDSNSGNDNSTQGTTVNQGADLSVSFNGATPATAGGGSTFTYTLDVANGGPNSAVDEQVVLTLPPQVTYQSGSNGSGWSCSASGQVVTCSRSSSVANGATAPALTVDAKVTGSSLGTFTALAVVSSSTADGDGDNNSATHDLTVTAGADLSIDKSVSPDPVVAEQAVTFTLNVTNNGPMSSDTVVVTDTLPANYSAISAAGTGWTCGVVSQTVTCNADTSLAQGSAPAITINATAPLNATIPPAGTTHSNTASLTSSTPDPVAGNDSKTINYSIGRSQADLSITKSKSPNPVAQGSPMSSTIQVQNNGPLAASGTIKVEDTLAAGESYSSAIPATGSGWNCSYSLADDAVGGVVSCTLAGPLALNASTPVLTIPTRAVGTGTMQNTACTSNGASQPPPENDFNTVNDCATAGGTTSTGATADLELSKTVDDPNSDGTLQDSENTLTYTLTVTNRNDTGDTGDAATNVVLTDPIPMYASHVDYGTTAVVATPSQGSACTIGATVSCNLGTINNGSSANVVITVTRPMKDGNWTNNASAFSTDIGDPDRNNNLASANTTVDPVADVAMTAKSQSGPIKAGVEATYVLSLKNKGVSTAQGVEVIDTFTNLNGMTYTFISATTNMPGASCSHNVPTNKVTCSGGTLTANESRSVTIKIRPDFNTGLTYPLNLENTATITTSTLESDGPAGAVNTNNSQSATLVVNDAEVDMLVQKQDFVDPLFYDSATPANNVITYEIKVTNQGPSYGTGINFVDTLTPASGQTLTFLCDKALQGDSCTGSTPGQVCSGQGTSISSATPINCSLPDMANGAITFRYLDFRVDTAPSSGGTTVQNSVVISSNEPESLSGNNTASDQTTIRVRADVEVTSKTPEFATVNLNQPFNWTILVTNNGPDNSAETTLDDTLPAGMVLTGAATATQGSCPTGAAGESIISCDLGALANGATATITVPVRVTSYSASLNNTATVSTSAVDQVAANNSKTSSVTVQKSSLAGFVYEDNNDDALKDTGENGINGVTLALTGTDIYGNTININTTTAGAGAFLFDNLPPSNGSGYTITETQPSGYVDGQENAAGTIVPNSNTTDLISAITVPANTAVTGYLFGELGSSSTTGLLSGYAYNDGSDDGTRDPGNPGIENVTITLTGTDTNGAVNKNTTTATDGSYSFPNLLPGTYILTQTHPTGYDDHIDTVGKINGTDNGTAGNDVINNIVLPAGGIGTEYNFADSNTAIAGFVYVDANNDGIKDTGETGIQGVTLTLTGTDVSSNLVNLVTTTDINGAYSFSGMNASDTNGYTVTETHPTAWADGKDTVGDVGGTAGNDVISGIVINAATFGADYNFGELGAALSGFVYNDNGDDGQKDNSDPGLPGVTITLTGTDLNGNTVNLITLTADNGNYRFDNLPLPDGSGFTITETQPTTPAGIISGKENTSNVISGVQITTPGTEVTGFNFGEIIPSAVTASVSGKVHDRDNPNKTYAGWTVEIVKNGVVVATSITDANSGYKFEGLLPGPGYEIRFRHPESNAVFGVIENINLTANTELPDQNLPLDPSGVVYDSVTRQPVPGAIVTLSGPSGFNPAIDLIGGAGNVNQIVGVDGLYKFLLNPTAPVGVYSLTVTQPAGYLAPNSVNIPSPCAGTLVVGPTPAPAAIQPQATAPAGGTPLHDPAACPAIGTSGTQYYLSFDLNATSADVINNHIPLDPTGQVTGLTVLKSTPKANVTRGELVPYTVRITNNLPTPITNLRIRDQIPPGFKYVANSAILDGVKTEPQINGRELTWPTQDYPVNAFHEVKLILVIGAGVGEGEYINQAWGVNGLTGGISTSIANATVRIIPDPTFDCSDLIGKVFDDNNTNGYQDEGEAGLPGVRVVTARGLLITTDANGRYHVPCAAVPNEMRGSNFIMKLDEQSLPSGYRVTTENPRVVRLTRGKLAKLNFGAAIHRVVRLDLNAKSFEQDSNELRINDDKPLEKLLVVLSKEPSVLRVAYMADGEDKKLVKQRLANFKKQLKSMWGDCDCDCQCHGELIIEDEVLWGSTATRHSASTGRAK